MGNKDVLTKKYMSKPERFADLFNAYIFNGEPVIDPAGLRDVDSANLLTISNNHSTSRKNLYTLQRYRDLIREAIVKQDDTFTYILLGIENQSNVDYAMPVRNLFYNALSYNRQVEDIADMHKGANEKGSFLSGFRKDDKLYPVITLTLYWGDEKWNAPEKLSDMLVDHPRELDKYIDDIDINLFSIIDDTTYLKCRTQLRDIFQALHYRNDREALETTLKGPAYRNLQKEEAEILSEFSSVRLPEVTPEGGYDMCKAVEEMLEEREINGFKNGKREGMQMIICSQIENGDINFETGMKYLQVNKDQLNALLLDFRNSKANAL